MLGNERRPALASISVLPESRHPTPPGAAAPPTPQEETGWVRISLRSETARLAVGPQLDRTATGLQVYDTECACGTEVVCDTSRRARPVIWCLVGRALEIVRVCARPLKAAYCVPQCFA